MVGISPQDAESHRKFAAQHSLNFTLLADPDKQAVKAYDVDGPLGFGVRRGTYLIGQDGKIQDSVLADLRIGAHEAFVKAALDAGAVPLGLNYRLYISITYRRFLFRVRPGFAGGVGAPYRRRTTRVSPGLGMTTT